MHAVFLVFFCLFHIGKVSSSDFPSVSTKLGNINGVYNEVKFKGRSYKVERFLGVPFAKPPVGKLRFKRPEPIETLSPNPFPAKKFGSPCAQVDIFDMKKAEDSHSEDCLFLNIFVPMQKPDKASGHAVMVYVHGGGFSYGTGNSYFGDSLAATGNVIVVTINYRLWIWGFLDLNSKNAQGNMGLWDQIMAFKWVNENIGSFGGDNERVTIFGHSAGSISAGIQALFPKNKGLFQNVIAQSGSPFTLNLLKNINENIQPAKYLAKLMNCNTDNVDKVFECIQKSNSATISEAFKKALKDPRLFLDIAFTPTIDGELMKSSPAQIMMLAKTGSSNELDFFRSLRFMNGINGDEGAMWLHQVDGTKESYEDLMITQEIMDSKIIPSIMHLVTAIRGSLDSEVLKALISSKYRNWKNPPESKNVRDQFVKLFGDIYFNVPAIETSRMHSNRSNAGSYLYRFTAAVKLHLVPTPSWVRSGNHADEIAAVFGYQLGYNDFVNGYTPPEWELDLSERVMDFFSNFAKYGDPNGGSAAERWPKYTTENEHFLNIDETDYVGQNLHAEDVNFWRDIVPNILDNCHGGPSVVSKKLSDTCGAEDDCH